MSMEIALSFIVTMVLSMLLIPLVMKAGMKLQIVAKMNKRTVHKKEVPRIGGYAIYISFLIGVVLFLKTDTQINAILLAGFLVFSVGFFDDIYDLSPKIKVTIETIAALIVIVYGEIYLQGFNFSTTWPPILPAVITIFWIVGITNAINLIDGLDGLSSGISIIVLITISMTSLTSGRTDIASLSLVLAGAIMGFLFFNFHPAKIFLGDSGALFIGFMISVISLLGFGYNISTFFTLGAPIVVLMVPIMDTLIAIIRRKLNKKKFSQADRKHLHHNLMFRLGLGHTRSVLVLYAVTILFSLTSFIYLYDATFGTVMFLLLMLIFELFVERTNMIGRKYKPLLTVVNIFIQSDRLPKIKALDRYLHKRTLKAKRRDTYIIIGILTLVFASGTYYLLHTNTKVPQVEQRETPYVKNESDSKLLLEIYTSLDRSFQSNQRDKECQLVAAYFLSDYLSLKNHTDGDIGAINYVYPSLQEDFQSFALQSYYTNVSEYPNLQVESYEVVSFSPSKISIVGLEDNQYYNVLISYQYNQDDISLPTTANVVLVFVEDRYYIVGIDMDMNDL